MNDNWRAKGDEPGVVKVRPYGCGQYGYSMSASEAAELRDELTKAIEEAERLADPFEAWWRGLKQANDSRPPNYRIVEEWVVSKDVARAIWKASKGG